MKNPSLSVLALVAALAVAQTFLDAQDAPPTAVAAATVEAIRLDVDRKIPESMDLYVGGSEGTEVVLYVKVPGKVMLETDQKSNIITKFADDRGSDLAKSAGTVAAAPGMANRTSNAMRNPLSTNLRVSGDGQAAALTIRSSIRPAVGATKLFVGGNLPVVCGTHSIKNTQNNVALVKDAPITIAGHAAKLDLVEDEGDQMAVAISSNQPFGAASAVRFLGADGHEIKSRISSHGSYGANGMMTYSISFMLDEKVRQADIECTYWDKTETINVPIDLELSIGI